MGRRVLDLNDTGTQVVAFALSHLDQEAIAGSGQWHKDHTTLVSSQTISAGDDFFNSDFEALRHMHTQKLT
jgi:hypothetical protein